MTFSLHPLFYIFGLYFAFTGKVFSFLTITFCAVVHEFGHALAAERRGYKLKKITLMPYGAVISGETGGMTAADEIYTVIFGPLVNLFTWLFILALWWLFPITYPYTELAATANFSLFFVNLLPAFPLDGGRLLLCLLTKPLGRKKASIITRSVGVFLSLSLLGLFAYSCFTTVNFSLAFFAAFLLFGAIEKRPDDRYIRLIDQLSAENVRKARTIKRLAVKQGFTVKDLYAAMDGASLYEIEIYSQSGKLLRKLPPGELCEELKTKTLKEPL